MMTKILAKMWRMKLLTEVKDFVLGLPFPISEKQRDDSIYFGTGEIDTGSMKYKAIVKVYRNPFGKLMCLFESKKAGVSEELPFNSETERQRASEEIQRVMLRFVN